MSSEPAPPIEIDVQEVQRLLTAGQIVLIDCREQNEWDACKIEGAQLIPMSRWLDATDEIKEMDGKQVVVHCHHGGRSLRVTNWLRDNGFPAAQNMTGGIDAWSQAIDPSIPRY